MGRMKKLMSLMLGLAFLGCTTVVLADDAAKDTTKTATTKKATTKAPKTKKPTTDTTKKTT